MLRQRHARTHRRPLLVCSAVRPSVSAAETTTTSSPTPTARSANNAVSVSDTQIASMTAGVLSRLLLHPIDCIKTRLQYFRAHSSSAEPSKALIRFIATERLAGLYRGIAGAVLGVIPYSLLYMPSYELAQQRLSSHLGAKELFGLRHVLAGSLAGLCGSFVKVPVDVVKKRVQAGLYPNVSTAIFSIINEAGYRQSSNVFMALVQRAASVRFFYAGWRSSIYYDVPYNSVQFLVLENVKRVALSMKAAQGKNSLSRTDNVFVGAITGMITSIITEPLDVVKTRMMTQNTKGMQKVGVTVYRGWIHCMSTMIREEGVLALWKGTLPRLVWVGASSAVWYGTYQAVRQRISTRELHQTRRRKNISIMETR